MTTTAQYASVPKNGTAQVSAANPNRDGTGALVVVAHAGSGGLRVDGVVLKATGTTTAGFVRFFITKGRPLGAIASITFTGTTAVMTFVNDHGLSAGNLLTTSGNSPDEYNVSDAVVSIVGAKAISYVMAVAPTANVTVLGSASATTATPTSRLLTEAPVAAVTPSASLASYVLTLGTQNASDKVFFPLVLQAGWTLRASTEKAETINILPVFMGDFS